MSPLLPEALRQGGPVGPRLVGGTTFAGKSAIDLAQIQILAQACLQGLDAARQVVFGWQRQGQSLEDIYLQGITPCARLLGDWWCADRLDFAMTTIASTHLQQLLYDFSAEFLQEGPQKRNGWSLLLMTEPGAQHSMGLFMLSEFFKRAGWTVTVGVPQDVAEFKRLFQSDWFDAVGISVSTDRYLDALANLLPQLKAGADNLGLRIFVGGPMALLEPECLNGIAAELVAEDAPATVKRITQRMPLSVPSTS
ncbi:B12-binding domain-containing protein [Limnohabitans sp. Rim47]|uniref:cobalamin B12-binding domain-containing protein n=1 Tax=Limnohabitans sp. Rim47 TaxID=1100721 RepID=UPI000360AA76|nr:cobalamin B12-binding domain-containing protein [Limnohabitans sp. Rim47]